MNIYAGPPRKVLPGTSDGHVTRADAVADSADKSIHEDGLEEVASDDDAFFRSWFALNSTFCKSVPQISNLTVQIFNGLETRLTCGCLKDSRNNRGCAVWMRLCPYLKAAAACGGHPWRYSTVGDARAGRPKQGELPEPSDIGPLVRFDGVPFGVVFIGLCARAQ
jgi:hypothetical protein